MTARFITFEGLDGSGKSTHVARVAARLASVDAPHQLTHEPGGTPLGHAIRDLFLDRQWRGLDGMSEALLVFASRRRHLLEVIDPALEAGRHVLCDRFTDSTLAYQGYGRGVSLDDLRELDRLVTSARRPDRTLLFDLDPREARIRSGGVDRLDEESLAFYSRVREGFLELAAAEPERFRVIDSGGEPAATAAAVSAALEDLGLEGHA